MPGYYDLWTVSLSYAIATLAGFAAFESVRHARQSNRRVVWATVSGIVLGFGIWSMHFVGMLAWVPPFPLFYSVSRTIVSLGGAVLASVGAMHLAVAPALPSRLRLSLGTAFVATGICAMHYIGMSAVHFSKPLMWADSWVATSCLIALIASFTALVLFNGNQREGFPIEHQVFGALAIGLAICGLHYSGMHAMMLPAGSVALRYSGDASGATLARIGVGIALIFTFCLLVLSYHERLGLLHSTHAAQLQAHEATRTAEQLNAAGRIAASIAHEVNNPLEAVTNLIYLVEQSEINPEARAYLHQAQSELRRVSEITTHSLKFHRQQRAASLTSLPELTESVLVLFGRRLELQQVVVRKDWPLELPKVLCLDGEIRQVVANLIENAIDSMPNGGSLSVSGRDCGSSIELVVTDTGKGIPEVARGKLFQPFYTTKGPGGTGLGLSISSEILQRHGGTLSFESRTEPPEQGTRFKMVLPMKLTT